MEEAEGIEGQANGSFEQPPSPDTSRVLAAEPADVTPLIRVMSRGTIPLVPALRAEIQGDAGAGQLDDMTKVDSPFANFFTVSTGGGPSFAITSAPESSALQDLVGAESIREIIRSTSQDSTLDWVSSDGAKVAVPESARRKRMAWGQGLKRQLSTPAVSASDSVTAAVDTESASGAHRDPSVSASEARLGTDLLNESVPSSADPPAVLAPALDCGGQPSEGDGGHPHRMNIAESKADISKADISKADISKADIVTDVSDHESNVLLPTSIFEPERPLEAIIPDLSGDIDSGLGQQHDETPNTGISLQLPSAAAPVHMQLPEMSSVLEARQVPVGSSHKKRAMRGVADNSQFNDNISQFKRSKPNSIHPVIAPIPEKAASEAGSAMDLCVATEYIQESGMKQSEEEELVSPDSHEARPSEGTDHDVTKEPTGPARQTDNHEDDHVKRKRGRPSSTTPGGGRGRGGGRQGGRGSRRRSSEQADVHEEEVGVQSVTTTAHRKLPTHEQPGGGTLNGMSELGGGTTPPPLTNRILLLGANSVKLCKSHRQRLRAKQQRDPMLSILCGKQDSINVFVAIHEIVRLELDSQGIDLMRLDPSHVIDPQIIQLLRNISHPSSIINLSILNCSDVAASLNLLETKGHKLYAELNAILQEMLRLQKERARLYDIHLRSLEQRQRLLVMQEGQRRGIVQNDRAAMSIPMVVEVPVKVEVSVGKRSVFLADADLDSACLSTQGTVAEAYSACGNSSSSSTPLIMHAGHPSYQSLIKNVQTDNRSAAADATFSTSAKSAQVAFNAVIPPDFVSLLHNLDANNVVSNLASPGGSETIALSVNGSCDRIINSLEFKSMENIMKNNRKVVMQEVRRRKLATRQAWEYLQDQFLETQHKWNHHVAIQRKEIADKQAVLDNLTRSQAASLAQEASSNATPSSGGHSVGGLGEYAPAVPTRPFGSSTRGGRVSTPEAPSAPDTPADPATTGRLNYGMRSTANSNSAGNLFGLGEASLYDHNSVMIQIAQAELMEKRIATGWAHVPSLLCPWTGPKRSDPPPPNEWPQAIAKLYSAKPKRAAPEKLRVEEVNELARITEKTDSDKMNVPRDTAFAEMDPSSAVNRAVSNMVDTVVKRAADGSDSADVADAVLTDLLESVAEKSSATVDSIGAALDVNRSMEMGITDVVDTEEVDGEVETPQRPANLTFPEPFPATPIHLDAHCNRLTTNGMRQICGYWPATQPCPMHCNCALKLDIDERRCRVWTDMEKCIFVDKFIQYPKNFPKIASFLVNRSVKDCVKFYYDSKHSFGFKALLRECQTRRRAVKCSWRQGIISAASAGGAVYAPDDSDDKRPIYELPCDDMTYLTRSAHPPNTDTLLQVPMPLLVSTDQSVEELSSSSAVPVPGSNVFSGSKLPPGYEVAKTTAGLAGTLDGRFMRPKTASIYMRRLVDTCDSDSDIEDESVENIRNNGYLASVIKKRKFDISSTMASGLSNAARIVADVEKAVLNNDSNVEVLHKKGVPIFGDSITTHVIDRPWRIGTACGTEHSSGPSKPVEELIKQEDTSIIPIGGAISKRKNDPTVQSPTRGRPRGGMSPRGGRGRGLKDRDRIESFETSQNIGEEAPMRGRGRGRGRGSRGGRGRGKLAGGDRPEGDVAGTSTVVQMDGFDQSKTAQEVGPAAFVESEQGDVTVKAESSIDFDIAMESPKIGYPASDVGLTSAAANMEDEAMKVVVVPTNVELSLADELAMETVRTDAVEENECDRVCGVVGLRAHDLEEEAPKMSNVATQLSDEHNRRDFSSSVTSNVIEVVEETVMADSPAVSMNVVSNHPSALFQGVDGDASCTVESEGFRDDISERKRARCTDDQFEISDWVGFEDVVPMETYTCKDDEEVPSPKRARLSPVIVCETPSVDYEDMKEVVPDPIIE